MIDRFPGNMAFGSNGIEFISEGFFSFDQGIGRVSSAKLVWLGRQGTTVRESLQRHPCRVRCRPDGFSLVGLDQVAVVTIHGRFDIRILIL